MNPLEKIREGVEKQDWNLVCAGYNAITGHNLSSPTDKPDTNDDDVVEPADDDEENVDFDEVTSDADSVGLYGNKTVLITEKPKQSHIEANKRRAEDRVENDISRPSPKTYQVKCTDCENTFDSPVRTGEFGQKCPKCLKSTNRER